MSTSMYPEPVCRQKPSDNNFSRKEEPKLKGSSLCLQRTEIHCSIQGQHRKDPGIGILATELSNMCTVREFQNYPRTSGIQPYVVESYENMDREKC